MRGQIRRKLAAGVRISAFAKDHPFTDPAHLAVVARFEDLLGKVQDLVEREESGRLDAAVAFERRDEVRSEISKQLIPIMVRLGAVAARENPDLAGRFKFPAHNAPSRSFLARARDIRQLAKANQALLSKHGLGVGQIDDLSNAIDRFDAANKKAEVGKLAHSGARKGMEALIVQLMELAHLLDALYRNQLHGDDEALGAWTAAVNVVNGPIRSKAKPSEGASGGAGQDGTGDPPPVDGGRKVS